MLLLYLNKLLGAKQPHLIYSRVELGYVPFRRRRRVNHQDKMLFLPGGWASSSAPGAELPWEGKPKRPLGHARAFLTATLFEEFFILAKTEKDLEPQRKEEYRVVHVSELKEEKRNLESTIPFPSPPDYLGGYPEECREQICLIPSLIVHPALPLLPTTSMRTSSTQHCSPLRGHSEPWGHIVGCGVMVTARTMALFSVLLDLHKVLPRLSRTQLKTSIHKQMYSSLMEEP